MHQMLYVRILNLKMMAICCDDIYCISKNKVRYSRLKKRKAT